MAYLGNAPVVGDSTNSFKLLDDIASFTLTFDATDTSIVSISGDTLSFTNHRFVTGQKVTYTDGGGTAIGGLTDGTSYFIIKVDQNTIKLATNASNAASSTAINLTSGAAGGSHTLKVAFDGVNTKFKATFNNGKKAKISRAGQISLSINGVIQQPQDSSSPSVGYGVEADSTIVFSTAPVATDKVFATFIGEVAASFDITDNTIDNFTGDGSTTLFNLSKEVPSSQDVLVTLDGVTQYPSDASTTRSYSIVNQSLTFVSAPDTGVAIQARHIGFAGATTSAVTGFYGRTGNAALINTDDISVQNISGVGATFTGNLNIEGVLTYEDVTNVDSIGIITARAGVLVGSGITLSKDGDVFFTGIATGNGSGLTALNATQLTSGTVPTARLGSGTASSSTFLRGDSTFQTVNTDLVSDTSPQLGGNLASNGNEIVMADNDKIKFGTGEDLHIFHDGNSRIQNTNNSSDLRIQSNAIELKANSVDEMMIKAVANGAVELYYDNDKKFETASIGVYSKSIMPSSHETYDLGQNLGRWNDIYIADNGKLRIGQGNDLQIYHNGSDSYIEDGGTGALVVKTNILSVRNAADNEQIATFNEDGAVELYYNNTKRLETTDGGNKSVKAGQNDFHLGSSDAGGVYILLDGDSNGDAQGSDYAYIAHDTGGDLIIAGDNPSGDAALIFKAGNQAEKLRILSGGGITFNGDTATANALDDYEEGTWTARFYPNSSAFASSSYNLDAAKYTKVGNVVYWAFRIRIASYSGGGGNLEISGLPYTVNSGQPQTTCHLHASNWADNSPKNIVYNSGSTRMSLYYEAGTANSASPTNQVPLSSLQANAYLIGQGFYFI